MISSWPVAAACDAGGSEPDDGASDAGAVVAPGAVHALATTAMATKAVAPRRNELILVTLFSS
jgi:hypothetical protein